jgi:hypothetical protein
MVTFSQWLQRTVLFLGLLSVGSSSVHAAKYSLGELDFIFEEDSLGATARLAGKKAKECFASLNFHLEALTSGTPKKRRSLITRQAVEELQGFMKNNSEDTLQDLQNLRHIYQVKFSSALTDNEELAKMINNFDTMLAELQARMREIASESKLLPGLEGSTRCKSIRPQIDITMTDDQDNKVPAMEDLMSGIDLKEVEQEEKTAHCGPVDNQNQNEDLTGFDLKHLQPVEQTEQVVAPIDIQKPMVVEPVVQPTPVAQPVFKSAPLLSWLFINKTVKESEAWGKKRWLIAPSQQQISQWWAMQQASK